MRMGEMRYLIQQFGRQHGLVSFGCVVLGTKDSKGRVGEWHVSLLFTTLFDAPRTTDIFLVDHVYSPHSGRHLRRSYAYPYLFSRLGRYGQEVSLSTMLIHALRKACSLCSLFSLLTSLGFTDDPANWSSEVERVLTDLCGSARLVAIQQICATAQFVRDRKPEKETHERSADIIMRGMEFKTTLQVVSFVPLEIVVARLTARSSAYRANVD